MLFRHQSGFTLLEVVIAVFIIGTVVAGMFGLFLITLRGAQTGERRIVAVALANERMEMVRNLPYLSVGTVGGVPGGSVPQQITITRNGQAYTVRTDIRYVDDEYDGLTGADAYNADYKQIRVAVSWPSQYQISPVLLISYVAPQGVEGGELGGTLDFQALDASGAPVAGATLVVNNDTLDPPISITTQTNDQGRVLLPGFPPANNSYRLSVTKDSYTQEQTYDTTATFFPLPEYSHVSMLAQQVTARTFFIDRAASLSTTTRDEAGIPLPTIAYGLRGTKIRGRDENNNPVYKVDATASTNAQGQGSHSGLEWDTYSVTIDGAATGYDIKETSSVVPVSIIPGAALNLTMTLVPHTPHSLHVTVVSVAGAPVDNATVHITNTGFDETKITGPVGQVFWADLAASPTYQLELDAPGFVPFVQAVAVSGTTRVRLELTAVAS